MDVRTNYQELVKKAVENCRRNLELASVPEENDNSSITVDSIIEFLGVLLTIRETYFPLSFEDIKSIISHESEHMRAAKERFAKYGNKVVYKYGVRFFNSGSQIYFRPFCYVSGEEPVTDDDFVYIISAPENLSDSDRIQLQEILIKKSR